MKRILYNELRLIKDSLPHGSIAKIASELGYSVETVRDYFHATAHEIDDALSFHYEKGGAEGGIVVLYDTKILEAALRLLRQTEIY